MYLDAPDDETGDRRRSRRSGDLPYGPDATELGRRRIVVREAIGTRSCPGFPCSLETAIRPASPRGRLTSSRTEGDSSVEVAPSTESRRQGGSRGALGTNGNLYRHLEGKLARYPIPEIRLPPGNGRMLLDVGGGWGRWSVAAVRAGYRPVVLDPQLELLLAATRVSGSSMWTSRRSAVMRQRSRSPEAPSMSSFRTRCSNTSPKPVARVAMAEMRRVTTGGGTVLVQLANRWGGRQLFTQSLQFFGIRNTDRFRVRYWSPTEMRRPSSSSWAERVEVDGFFSLNVQPADLDLMPFRYRALIRISNGCGDGREM